MARFLLRAFALVVLAVPVSAQCLIDTPSQRAIWDRMKAENHPGYQQIRQNAAIDRYNDIGRWDLLRYVIDHDPVYGRKSFEDVRTTTQNWTWIFTGNESREYMIELAMLYGCLKPVLTPEEDAAYKGWLIAVADKAIAALVPSDSDQATGNFLGLLVLDKVAGTAYGSSTYLNAMTGKPVPIGGLDATGANYLTLRNAIRLFTEKMAAGGNWIESTDYNLGTTLLLYMGASWAGLEHFPEVLAFAKQHAIQQMHEVTPNLKDSQQWGDNEHPHELSLAVHHGDLWPALAGILTPTAPGLAAAMRGFEDAVFAANNYTRNPLYARTYYWFDPYAPRDPNWKTTAGNFLVTPGTGHVYWRDGAFSAMAQFPNWANGLVDHVGARQFGDLRVFSGDAFLLDHPLAYAPDPQFANQVLVNGTGPSFESGGLLATKYEPGQYAYAAGANAGVSSLISQGDAVNVPIYLHENTRQIVQFFGPEITLIIADRVHAEDVYTQKIGDLGFEQFYTYDLQRQTFAKRHGVKDWNWHMPVQPTLTPTGFTWNAVTVTRLLPADLQYSVVDESATTFGGYINASEKKWAVHGVPATQRDFDLILHVVSTGTVQAVLVDQGDKKGVTITRNGQSHTVLFGATPGPKLTLAMKDGRVVYDVTKINAIAPYVSVSIDGVEIPTPLRPVDAPAPSVDPTPTPTPTPAPTNSCGYAITPPTLNAPAAGGTLTFVVGPYASTCAAPVFISGAGWLSVSGATSVTALANPTTAERSTVLVVGSDVVGLVIQAAGTGTPTPVPEPTMPPEPTPTPTVKTCSDGVAVHPAGSLMVTPPIRPNNLEKERARYTALGWVEDRVSRTPPNYYLELRCVGK